MVAVALVAGAFVVRSRRDNATASGGPGSTVPGATTTRARPAGPLRVVCATELKAVCAGLGADRATTSSADAGATLAAVSGGDAAGVLDVWVTLDPWPQMADLTTDVFTDDALVLGAGAVGFAIRKPRADVLSAACKGTITTLCIGTQAGLPWSTVGGQATWGTVKPVFDRPTTSAVGLVAYTAAVVAPPAPASLARIDLENDDAFMRWARQFGQFSQQMNPSQGTAMEQARQLSRYDIVLTTEQDHRAVAGDSFTFVALAPVQAHVVAAARNGVKLPTALADELAKLTQDLGWNAPVRATSLPTPAAVAGLQEIWKQATA